MCLHQHILETQSSEIRINSQYLSLHKCTFSTFDNKETWEADHTTHHVFEFLKIFCVYIWFVILLFVIRMAVCSRKTNGNLRYKYTCLSCENKTKCSIEQVELVRPLWNQPGLRFLPALGPSVPRVWRLCPKSRGMLASIPVQVAGRSRSSTHVLIIHGFCFDLSHSHS